MEKPTNVDLPVDNSPITWGSPRVALAAIALLATAAGAGAAWFVSVGDPTGALLIGVLAVALLAVTLYGIALNPRLAADAHGIRVKTATGTVDLPWQAVNVAVIRTSRLGRDVDTLELELERADAPGTEPTLVVLGRFELGADPVDVLDRLCELRAQRDPQH